jgi:hypothetical protein
MTDEPTLASEADERFEKLLRAATRKGYYEHVSAQEYLLGILEGKYPPFTRDEIDREIGRRRD